ncbi:MerR family transcriptional regulator [Bacillus sp. 03113]|uniref:MerR family transcriptional regulator n=1 Tax=Bacillus sp. 03113 TaxID=2578211 RepID=UPI0011428367|nr:MerR family transcriptional regulator [Bacillus sp. 03113]
MEEFIYGTEPKYSIKEVSKITKLPKPTIRYYEEIGLLQNIARDRNNIRLFSDDQIMRLRMIQCMRSTGMGIDMIRHYIGLSIDDTMELKEKYSIVLNQETILLAQKQEIEAQLALIEHKKENYEKKLNKV